MRPASFDMELSTAWSRWALEHGLPELPDRLADRTSVPVAWWRGPDSAAVLHLRRWSGDEDQEPRTEVDVEVFEFVGGSWRLAANGGAGGWQEAVVGPVQVEANHADLSGVVQGTAGGAEVVALWGEAGASADTVEVEQDGVVTAGPLTGELGWVVVSALVRGPVVARIRDGAGRVLAEGTAGPWEDEMAGPWSR